MARCERAGPRGVGFPARTRYPGRPMSAAAVLDEPLVFERIPIDKVWGGRTLESALAIPLPAGRKIGETWGLCDRVDRNSIVARCSFRGRSLHEVITEQAHR